MVKAIWSLNFLIVNVLKFHCDPRKKNFGNERVNLISSAKNMLIRRDILSPGWSNWVKGSTTKLTCARYVYFFNHNFWCSILSVYDLGPKPNRISPGYMRQVLFEVVIGIIGWLAFIIFFAIHQIFGTFGSASIHLFFKAYNWLLIILLLPPIVIWRSVMKIAVAGDVDFCMLLMAFGS